MKRQYRNQESLARELARLPGLDRAALAELWRELYMSIPAGNISRSLMIRAIAYRLQENALGGLKPAMLRFLEKVAEDNATLQNPSLRPINLTPGIRLIREWHGITHEVIILEKGVFFSGKTYKSLTEVAKVITGAKWSGPAFFGLRKKAAQ